LSSRQGQTLGFGKLNAAKFREGPNPAKLSEGFMGPRAKVKLVGKLQIFDYVKQLPTWWIVVANTYFNVCTVHLVQFIILLLLPLALQPAVGFGLSNNTSPFVPIYDQLSLSFAGSSSSSRPFQFLSEDLFGHPILLHSLQVTQPTYPLPLYQFYYIFSFTQLF